MFNDITASAAALIDGGWVPGDRDNLIAEYDLTAEEADALIDEMRRLLAESARDWPTITAQEIIDRGLFDAAVALMDDDTREAVNYDLAPCTDLELLEEYMKRHEDKYGVPFVI